MVFPHPMPLSLQFQGCNLERLVSPGQPQTFSLDVGAGAGICSSGPWHELPLVGIAGLAFPTPELCLEKRVTDRITTRPLEFEDLVEREEEGRK